MIEDACKAEECFSIDELEDYTKEVINMKDQLMKIAGDFTWLFDDRFFIETKIGNFVWSDPRYNGDNSFTSYSGVIGEYLKTNNIEYGRSKGIHLINEYCGPNFSVNK